MIDVVHFEQINRTEAYPLALEGHVELLRQGLAEPVESVSWENEALLAKQGSGELAGVLVFGHQKWNRSFWVQLGFVRPQFRRQGVYRAMWRQLVTIAQARKIPVILGATSVSNTDMQRVMAQLDRSAYAIQYAYKVTDQQ